MGAIVHLAQVFGNALADADDGEIIVADGERATQVQIALLGQPCTNHHLVQAGRSQVAALGKAHVHGHLPAELAGGRFDAVERVLARHPAVLIVEVPAPAGEHHLPHAGCVADDAGGQAAKGHVSVLRPDVDLVPRSLDRVIQVTVEVFGQAAQDDEGKDADGDAAGSEDGTGVAADEAGQPPQAAAGAGDAAAPQRYHRVEPCCLPRRVDARQAPDQPGGDDRAHGQPWGQQEQPDPQFIDQDAVADETGARTGQHAQSAAQTTEKGRLR